MRRFHPRLSFGSAPLQSLKPKEQHRRQDAEPAGRRTPAQSRLMSHGPAPPEGSLEAKVRHYLPKDYHVR